jgi:hypothetical protein
MIRLEIKEGVILTSILLITHCPKVDAEELVVEFNIMKTAVSK